MRRHFEHPERRRPALGGLRVPERAAGQDYVPNARRSVPPRDAERSEPVRPARQGVQLRVGDVSGRVEVAGTRTRSTRLRQAEPTSLQQRGTTLR
jgi:hypothetical protein